MIAGFCGESEEDHAASLDLLQRVGYDQAFLFAYSRREGTHAARHLEVHGCARLWAGACLRAGGWVFGLGRDARPARPPTHPPTRHPPTHAPPTHPHPPCPPTHSTHVRQDDVPEGVKGRRLRELIDAYRAALHARQGAEAGRRHLVLVEGRSRRSPMALTGRTDTFKRVVFEDEAVPATYRPVLPEAHRRGAPLGAWEARGGGGMGSSGRSSSTGGDVADPALSPLVRLAPGDYVAVEVTGGGSTLRARALARTTLSDFVAAHGSAAPLEYFGAREAGGGGGGADDAEEQVGGGGAAHQQQQQQRAAAS